MANESALRYFTDQVHYLRENITFADNGVARVIGVIPAGSLILKPASGVHVVTVFNAGTSNVLDVGMSSNDDLFATDLALGTATFVPLDEAIGGFRVDDDTTITATATCVGALTTGDAEVVICFIPPKIT